MEKEILDAPISLKYNNGSSFPDNSKMIGYGLLATGVISSALGVWMIGPPILLVGLFICFTHNGVEFNPENQEVTEYTKYLGFIPVRKTFSYEKWGFLSVVPLRITSTVYARSSNSTSLTDNYFTICLIGENYRSKKELIRMDSKSNAQTTAKALSHRLGLPYFEYDPQVVRDAFRK